MKKIILGFVAFACSTVMVYAQEAKSPMKVEVVVKSLYKNEPYVGPCIDIQVKMPKDNTPSSVRSCPYQAAIDIVVRLKNNSKDDTHLSGWSCSYWDDFVIDNKYMVHPSFLGCDKNILVSFILQPNQMHEWPLRLMVSSQNPDKDVRFKVGYKAKKLLDVHNYGSMVPISESPFWSDEVVVHIK